MCRLVLVKWGKHWKSPVINLPEYKVLPLAQGGQAMSVRAVRLMAGEDKLGDVEQQVGRWRFEPEVQGSKN